MVADRVQVQTRRQVPPSPADRFPTGAAEGLAAIRKRDTCKEVIKR